MTAPISTTAAPAAEGTPAGGDAASTAGGQAPPAGNPADTTGATGAPKPPGGSPAKRTEQVRTASREDTGPTGDDPADDTTASTEGQAPTGDDWRIEDLPPGARKHIESLRKEAGKNRTEANKAKEAATAADERFAGAVEAFMGALGLTPPAETEAVPPEQQLADITKAYRERTVELAVYRAAGAHDGDAEALLDSRTFLRKALALDPAAEDFHAKVAEAIAEAVQENPKLRAAQPAPVEQAAPSGGDFRGGPAATPGPDEWGVDDFRRERHKALNGTTAA